MAAAGDRRRDQRHRCEGQQQKQQDLREDDPDRERADQAEGAELADEDDQGEQEALVLAYMVRDASQELAPVRNKIGEALKQLRPYRDRSEPLIVCLANPSRLMVPSEDPDDVIAAMYGEPGIRVSIATPENPDPPLDDAERFFGRNGVFGGCLHPYVSAVMTLHEREDAIERWHDDIKERLAGVEDRQERAILTFEATREPAFAEADATPGSYRFVRVFETHNIAATAPPVPRDLFTGPRDEFRAYNPENGCLGLLR